MEVKKKHLKYYDYLKIRIHKLIKNVMTTELKECNSEEYDNKFNDFVKKNEEKIHWVICEVINLYSQYKQLNMNDESVWIDDFIYNNIDISF